METKTYTTIDRKAEGWLPGPWDDEPEDKVQWQDEATGLPCLAVRGPFGSWCGYVGVAAGHPYFGKHYDEIEVAAHGGLTFADFCQPDAEREGICHVPGPGEPDHVWWLGFDCSHSHDAMPSRKVGFMGDHRRYRTLAYVKDVCLKMAAQIKGAAA